MAHRLALVVGAWSEVFTAGRLERLVELLDEDVQWDGVLPGMHCHDRAEVLQMLGRLATRPPRVTRVEAEEFDDNVAVSVTGPDFAETDALAAGTPRSLVFTFSGDRVARMRSFATRDEAFAAAQAGRG